MLRSHEKYYTGPIWVLSCTVLTTLCGCLGNDAPPAHDWTSAAKNKTANCTISPRPASTGDFLSVQGSGLGRRMEVRIDVRATQQSFSLETRTDRRGKLALQSDEAIKNAGSVSVSIVGLLNNNETHLAECSTEVIDEKTCGNGACDADERCDTCTIDCGSCPEGKTYLPACTRDSYDGTLINQNGQQYIGVFKVEADSDAVCLTSSGTPTEPAIIDGGIVAPEDIETLNFSTWSESEAHDYWEEYYHTNTLRVRGDSNSLHFLPVIEFVHIRNASDGISLVQYDFFMPSNPADDKRHFTIRDVYIQRAGDDAIENDWLASGLVQRVLIDGAFMGFGMRARSSDEDSLLGASANTLAIEDSVVRLTPQYATYRGRGRVDEPGSPLPAHVGFFKWDGDPELNLGLELRNNVFVAYHQPASGSISMDPEGRVDASKSSGNVVVWLGKSAYPHTLPAWATCTRDISVFKEARGKWFSEHPQFLDPYLEAGKNPAERFWKTHRSDLAYEEIARKSCFETL